jgi:2,4-dienoyl-CoA reductase-like NADH-dependent reductase (Old Yellow Enzyme family)
VATPSPAPSPDPSPGPSSGPSTSPAFTPYRLGPLTLRNRIVKAATFEGVMPRGAVTEELVAFHRAVAAGGAALTTVAYCAVSPGGRVQRHTLVMADDAVPDLRRLTDAVHEEGGLVSAQLGHAGLVANVRSNGTPTLAPSSRFSAPAMARVKAATTAQLDEVEADFRRAARVAVAAGFDAVEVHLGHGYLLSSFLSPDLNRRKDAYGGDIRSRSAYPRRVVAAVREEVGDAIAVTAKLGMADGPADGLGVDDALVAAALLEADGHLDAMELTAGSSLRDSMFLFRGDVPMAEMVAAQPRLVGLGLRTVGRRMFPHYPFEEGYLLPMARRFRAELDLPLIALGGINRLATIEGALAEGFDLVAMGRALLRDPDLPRRMEAGTAEEGACIHCNRCMPTIYSGTRCVVTHPDPPSRTPLAPVEARHDGTSEGR